MFKKSALVILFSMLSTLTYAQGTTLEGFQTLNIVRVKLWYEGVSSQNNYNQALIKGKQRTVELPEELTVALDLLDS